MKVLFKGGVYDSRKTGGAFCGAADRAMESLEGGAVAAKARLVLFNAVVVDVDVKFPTMR